MKGSSNYGIHGRPGGGLGEAPVLMNNPPCGRRGPGTVPKGLGGSCLAVPLLQASRAPVCGAGTRGLCPCPLPGSLAPAALALPPRCLSQHRAALAAGKPGRELQPHWRSKGGWWEGRPTPGPRVGLGCPQKGPAGCLVSGYLVLSCPLVLAGARRLSALCPQDWTKELPWPLGLSETRAEGPGVSG